MKRAMTAVVLALIATTTASAQERRSPGGPSSGARETIQPMPRFPYVGTWHGRMMLRLDTVPVSTDIAVMNDSYTSVSYGPDGGRMNHLSTELAKGTLRWKIKNSGPGEWVYEARRIVGDTIFGTVTLQGYPGRDGKAEAGTLLLVRQRR
jgi:hypothetical protein